MMKRSSKPKQRMILVPDPSQCPECGADMKWTTTKYVCFGPDAHNEGFWMCPKCGHIRIGRL